MQERFLTNPFHIVKYYELRKMIWQSGGGHSSMQEISKV